LVRFCGFSPRRLFGYALTIHCYVRSLRPLVQGLTIGFVHNARARKSCAGIPFDFKYVGRFVPVTAADPCVAALTTCPQHP
jgi:hypothetical protein